MQWLPHAHHPVGYAFEHLKQWVNGVMNGREGKESMQAEPWTEMIFNPPPSYSAGFPRPRAQRCYAKKWLIYALGRPLHDSEKCLSEQIEDRFIESGGNIQQLLIDISTSDAFLYLPVEQP